MRSLSIVESAALVSLAGSVLAVGAPAFVRNFEASRLAEPVDGLKHLAARATMLAEGELAGRYPESAPPSPREVPQGRAVDPPEVWQHPTWVALGFGFDKPHRYRFTFESAQSDRGASFRAKAEGDLDGDGVLSSFSVEGSIEGSAAAVVLPLEVERDIE